MKQVIISILAIAASFNLSAQTTKKQTIDQKIAARFSNTIAQLKEITINDPAQVGKVAAKQVVSDELVEEALRLLNEEIARRDKEIEQMKNDYVPHPSENGPQNIDKDLLPLLSGIPQPVAGLPQAKAIMKGRYDETVFATYIEKLERHKEQLAEVARRTLPADMNESTMKKKAEAEAARAMQQVNNNPVIQQMGGMEKLQSMTPEQREAFAKQMAAKVRDNPMDYTGAASDPRKAFTQKLMTDAGYKAKFEHMNRQQQIEEYELFLKENGFTNTPKKKEESNDASISIAIDKRMIAIVEHMQQLAQVAGSFQKQIDDHFAAIKKKISNQYARLVDALPMVEHGEAGSSKDTYELDIANQIVLYSLNAQNAIANKEIWKRYLTILKITIAEYNDLFSEYWGKSKETDRLMIEKGVFPASVAAGICDQMIGLTKTASAYTSEHAGWQKAYEGIVLHIYE